MITVDNFHYTGDEQGNWTKQPGWLAIRFELSKCGTAEIEAKRIGTAATKLAGIQVETLQKKIASFVQSYLDFNEYLHTPQGNVPVKIDSAKIHNHLHSYLFAGRELIEYLGRVVHICYGMKEGIGGFNKKKFTSLRKNIVKAESRLKGLDGLVECLDKHESQIVLLIAMRDRLKTHNDVIIDLPWIDPDCGPHGGLLSSHDESQPYDFVIFFKESYKTVMNFTEGIVTSSV